MFKEQYCEYTNIGHPVQMIMKKTYFNCNIIITFWSRLKSSTHIKANLNPIIRQGFILEFPLSECVAHYILYIIR